MNKQVIIGLLLVANLYGQMASANEVAISEGRLQNISAGELSILLEKGAIRVADEKVYLNLQKLELILRDPFDMNALAVEADKSTSRFVPYGYSASAVVSANNLELAESLSARFVPYGNT